MLHCDWAQAGSTPGVFAWQWGHKRSYAAAVFRTEARARIGLPPLVVPLSEFDNPAFIQALAGHTILESGRLEYYEHLNVRLNEILGLLEAENARAP